MTWQAVAVSTKGTKHERSKQPCQDYGDYRILSNGQVIVGAVSDGMGSASHSEVGSKLAVRVVLEELESRDWKSRPEYDRDVKVIFDSSIRQVKKAFELHAWSENYPVQTLACTLLAFVATPEWLIAMQVGDGFIVAQTGDENLQLLFKPDKGEFANETTSVTSSNVFSEAKVSVNSNPYSFICVSTDGIENISLIKREGWKPFGKFFSPLQRHMQSDESLERKREDLEKFLNSEKLNQKTDDDKTLLLCVYKYPEVLDKREIHQEQDSPEIPNQQYESDANTNEEIDQSSSFRDVQPSDNSDSESLIQAEENRQQADEGESQTSDFKDTKSSKVTDCSVQDPVSQDLQVAELSDLKLENGK
jgi:serine/threonine protein phosphatase PrpC